MGCLGFGCSNERFVYKAQMGITKGYVHIVHKYGCKRLFGYKVIPKVP